MVDSKAAAPTNVRFQSCVHIARDGETLAMSVAISFDTPSLKRSFKNQFLSLCAYCAGTFHGEVMRSLHLYNDPGPQPEGEER